MLPNRITRDIVNTSDAVFEFDVRILVAIALIVNLRDKNERRVRGGSADAPVKAPRQELLGDAAAGVLPERLPLTPILPGRAPDKVPVVGE